MRICIPAENDNGLKSIVYGHFGSAPYFVIYDTENKIIEVINNNNEHHEHGQCNPVAALGGKKIDILVTGGIGSRALQRLNAVGIKAYQAISEKTVSEVISRFSQNELPEITLNDTCSHHHGDH